MRRLVRVLTLLLMLHGPAVTADEPAPFRLVRSDENYNPNIHQGRYSTAPEPWKYVPLTADGETYLSFGGEIRERYDVFDAPRFGIRTRSDSYDLQRLLLHGDLHFGRRLRLYAELGKHEVFGKRTAVLPVDESPTNFQNLFIDILPDAAERWRVRVGRQELLLNPTQRFISVREGPNLRQSYDGARVSWTRGAWKVDAFSFRPMLVVKPDAFDNRGDPNSLFSGAYVSHAIDKPEDVIEGYWLAYDHWNAQYGTKVGPERRRTVGTRVALHKGGWDLDTDLARQYGTFAGRDIRAWAIGADGGFTFDTSLKPRLGLRFDGASGGSSTDPNSLDTFNPLFPKGLYFDESMLTTYANLLSVRPSLTITPVRTLTLQVSEAWRWKQTVQDNLYLIPFVPIPQTAGTAGKYVGRWTIVDGNWRANRWLTFQGEYVHVAAAEAVQAARGHDVDFFMLIAQLRF